MASESSETAAHRATNLIGELTPYVLGAVVRRFGDFYAAEDAVQEALIAAATRWPAQGVPANPRAWLIKVASRRMIDQIRGELTRRRREATWTRDLTPASNAAESDPLILLFMCCHPALTPASAIALTLRAVGGLTTAEIARAFLVPETTMAQRISRAKQNVRDSGVRFALPTDAERHARLTAVLHVLYLMFNEGYTGSSGPDLVRGDLARDAIRLTRSLRAGYPDDGEVAGLLALMILTDARRPARVGPNGELIPLSEQDRALWDRAGIAEGVALISETLKGGRVGPYQIQAAIAAVHDEAASTAATDWPQILALYGLLELMNGGPMVRLNTAVAVAMVRGPAAGLQVLHELDGDRHLGGHFRLDAVRAHLYEMAGDVPAAIRHYRAAASRTTSIPEQNYLRIKAARLAAEHENPSQKLFG